MIMNKIAFAEQYLMKDKKEVRITFSIYQLAMIDKSS